MSIQHPYRQLDEVTEDTVIPDLQHVQASTISEIYHSRVQPNGSAAGVDADDLAASIKWPRVVGIVQIINGFITGFLGLLEVFILPILEDPRDEHAIVIGKRNCYAAGILAGIMMLITGSTAVRSSISQRGSTIQRFMIMTLISVVVYTLFSTLFIYGYSKGWTQKSSYPEGSSLYEVHIFLTASTLLGLMFVVTAFIQYFEVVFFGNIQLCKKCLACLPCCFKIRNDLLEEESSNRLV